MIMYICICEDASRACANGIPHLLGLQMGLGYTAGKDWCLQFRGSACVFVSDLAGQEPCACVRVLSVASPCGPHFTSR